ncbi:MAG: C69 family dipeptidase [Deltaproteobacteria bacterium]|nr:C69 family dipeptidase [Deltaproteobacteria bacterium]
MCDCIVIVDENRVLFAKNSDRDANEAQVLEWHAAAEHARGATLRCTWIEIPQVERSNAVLISRPWWMWGAEMGANEHGVVIGNEAVFTRQPYASSGLTGMDLLRLALERADTAERAVEVLVELLERHGQGGSCCVEHKGFTYHNSFLAADPRGAFVLETAGRLWAAERVQGARTISNGLTIESLRRQHSDPIKTWGSGSRTRQARSRELAAQVAGPADLFKLLRDHGASDARPRYSWVNGGLNAICAHAGGMLASSQTTASFVAELTPVSQRFWATGTAAPCTSLFKPVRLQPQFEQGSAVSNLYREVFWWRHERFHRRVVRAPDKYFLLFADERDQLERRWLDRAPEPLQAFAEHERCLAEWLRRVNAVDATDERPWWARRHWRERDRAARLPPA